MKKTIKALLAIVLPIALMAGCEEPKPYYDVAQCILYNQVEGSSYAKIYVGPNQEEVPLFNADLLAGSKQLYMQPGSYEINAYVVMEDGRQLEAQSTIETFLSANTAYLVTVYEDYRGDISIDCRVTTTNVHWDENLAKY